MVEMKKWDITNITEWLQDFQHDFDYIHTKFRLKVDYNSAWEQYKRWINATIEHHDFDAEKYNYSRTITLNLQNKKFVARNKDLCLIFDGILTEGFSNAFAEHLGHIGNVMVPSHRKGND